MGQPVWETEYLSVTHAAHVVDASQKTVRRWLRLLDDPLPAIRLGSGTHARIRIPRRELLAWLGRRRATVPTRDIVDAIVTKVTGA